MAEPTPQQHRSTARIARITAVVSGITFVGLLVTYLIRGDSVSPHLFGLLLLSGGLLVGAEGLEKKAKEAETTQGPPPAP